MHNDNTRAIEMWPIDEVRPNPDNPRVHPEEQIAVLAASLREFDWVRPMLVDENKMVLVGHGMLAAARQAPSQSLLQRRLLRPLYGIQATVMFSILVPPLWTIV